MQYFYLVLFREQKQLTRNPGILINFLPNDNQKVIKRSDHPKLIFGRYWDLKSPNIPLRDSIGEICVSSQVTLPAGFIHLWRIYQEEMEQRREL